MELNWEEYTGTARQAVAEGQVLLKNRDNLLPLKEGCKLAVFGRMQNHYYKSGTGSGGMVNVPKVWGIMHALKEENIELNSKLVETYLEFDKENPYNMGIGFGSEPWSQKEMKLTKELAEEAAKESEVAMVIIARTAGEEQDYVDAPGAYRLSEDEVNVLKTVRAAFDKMVVVMNVSAVLDMQDIEAVDPEAVLYAWQGGEVGGLGTVDVLMGRVCPSGRLVDTMVRKIEDAPAHKFFGKRDSNNYAEDIYVGYRYYETFCPEVVLYPFGYGLSYTSFDMKAVGFEGGAKTEVKVYVTNTGSVSGKEVVQVYVTAPQGELGKPKYTLVGFAKTEELKPGESQTVTVTVDEYVYASYDETGKTGYTSAYVLEKGTYEFSFGHDVRSLEKAGEYSLDSNKLLCQLTQQMAPSTEFDRMKPVLVNGKYEIGWEKVPTAPNNDHANALADDPAYPEYTGDKGIKLKDVRDGKADMKDFIAQISNDDLTAIVRGEGMGSPKVTPGTAAAFGGVTKNLKSMGVPCGCCSDGPSGMRLDSGTRAFSLPNGTMLACTWNLDLNKKLYGFLGLEMTKNRVDVLLGPGINIHRYPLNGRNFEYFSEDPVMTGLMASAQIGGMQSGGTTGTLKHFCGNNQETNRHNLNSEISERALREIYLKGYEMAVRNGANSIMTTYGSVNGIWTNGRYDLNTTILRGEWGFKGIVMTDWWANIGDFGKAPDKGDFARMVIAQNDFYAVCPDASTNSSGDNLMAELEKGTLTRGQLCRCAENICEFLMHTNAMKRMVGESTDIEVINCHDEVEQIDPSTIPYYEVEDGTEIDMSHVLVQKGCTFVFGIDALKMGCYYMDMVGSSELSELAQINIAVFMQSISGGTFGFHGSGGKDMTVTRKILLRAKYGVVRLYFAGNGLKLNKIKFRFEKELDKMNYDELDDYIYG